MLMHLVLNRLSLGPTPTWRFRYDFEWEDMAFAKDRIVEILLTNQVGRLVAQALLPPCL